MARKLASTPEGPRRVDRCIDLLWETFHEPHFWADLELWTAARTNPALRPEERRLRQAIRTVSDRIWGPAVCSHPVYPEVREMLLTSMQGAALVYAFEYRCAHLTMWKSITRRLLAGS